MGNPGCAIVPAPQIVAIGEDAGAGAALGAAAKRIRDDEYDRPRPLVYRAPRSGGRL
jgi:hypothetical protein